METGAPTLQMRAGSLRAARQGMTDERNRMVDPRDVDQRSARQWCRLVRRDYRPHSMKLRREVVFPSSGSVRLVHPGRHEMERLVEQLAFLGRHGLEHRVGLLEQEQRVTRPVGLG